MGPAQLRNTSHSPPHPKPLATPLSTHVLLPFPRTWYPQLFVLRKKNSQYSKLVGRETTFTGTTGESEEWESVSALYQPRGQPARGHTGWALLGPGASFPRAGACSITRAAPTLVFITSSVLSPPPSLPELLGLAVPLASLGGS